MRAVKPLLVLITAFILSETACRRDVPEEPVVSGGENVAVSEDGVPIYFESRGQGDYSLVFVHGWCTDMSYWRDQIPSFRVYYRVVTLDLAGHGRSGRERALWSVPAFGRDVAAVVKELDLRNVILIGHSLGGAAAIEAAAVMPDRVIGLVGVEAFSDLYLDAFPEERIEASLAPFRKDFQEAVRVYALENYFRSSSPERLKKRIILEMAETPADIGIGALEELLRYDAGETLQRLSIPARALNADRPLAYFRVIRGHIENFRVKFEKNVGHFLMLEDPQTFNRDLSEAIGQIIQASYGAG
jgi:pimeloyl-ACP methyl ester carboxylesterase